MACLCTTLGLLVLTVTTASAAVTHDLLSQITEVPSEGPHGEKVALPGPLSGVNATTFDSGKLWVAEHIEGTNNFRLDEFAPSGNFLSQPAKPIGLEELQDGVAVGHANGEYALYVGSTLSTGEPEGAVAILDESGALESTWTGVATPSKSFGNRGVRDVAVDNSGSPADWAAGDVYVATLQGIDVYAPEAGGKGAEPKDLAAQLTGTCPSADTTCGPVEIIPFNNPQRVVVDQSNGDVLVDDDREEGGEYVSVLDLFRPTAFGQYEFITQISGPPGKLFPSDTVPAVDALGAIDVGYGNGGGVEQFQMEGPSDDTFTYVGKFPFGAEIDSLTFDPENDNLYVGYGNQNTSVGGIDVFGPDIAIPDVEVSEPPSYITPTGATLRGKVDTDDAGEASCEFEYGTTTAYGLRARCTANIANGSAAAEVESMPITGLSPDTTYYYRLDATNIADTHTNTGLGPEDLGQFTTAGARVDSESVSDVGSTSVTFEATIEPNHAPTTYYFQYGPTTAYGGEAPLKPGATIGASSGEVPVSEHTAENLLPNHEYHYHVIAVSELEGKAVQFEGPDKTFTTEHSGEPLTLPDGRQWELVSPPDIHGQIARAYVDPEREVGQFAYVEEASAGGSAMTYATTGTLDAQAQGSTVIEQVLSSRGSAGWSSTDISTSHTDLTTDSVAHGNVIDGNDFFSEDLATALVQPVELGDEFTSPTTCAASGCASATFPEASEYTLLERHDDTCESEPTHCYEPLVTETPGYDDVPTGAAFGIQSLTQEHHSVFVSATPDLQHVVLQSEVPLVASATDRNEFYEWSAEAPATERLKRITALPKSEGGGPVPDDEQLKLGSPPGHSSELAGGWHAISDDGSHVFWSTDPVGSGQNGGPIRLFMTDTAKGEGETIRLDVPQPGAPSGGTSKPIFLAANSEGTKVFFEDSQPLMANSGTGNDLYECAIVEEAGKDACKLSNLTPEDKGESSSVTGTFIPGTSEDGSYVYFSDTGVFGSGRNSEGQVPVPGGRNLYEWHEGAEPALTFIATVGDALPENSDAGMAWGWSSMFEFDSIGWLSARVSPNGRYLAFTSAEPLTGYDNRDVLTGARDQEMYLYDAEAKRLACASCDPTGARPVGSAVVPNPEGLQNPYARQAIYQPRYLSDSGRLFFNSPDALVPQDVNGQRDVYQYEPAGIGSCSSASPTYSERSGGCAGLISSGTASDEATLYDASASGGDVFFTTSAKLSAQAEGNAILMYDAHECTPAAPCVPAAVVPPPCQTGDSCKGAPTPQPSIFGPGGSATFSGSGNPGPQVAPVAKGKPALTRVQMLARALKACRKKPRKRRSVCEKSARKSYGRKK
ncbi:MAG TPA: hypothetical protein VK730_09700 [Solirubrobacteraceae bacterium]|nr:hypothetical protein [Solirubrobacteraceae bacterium]